MLPLTDIRLLQLATVGDPPHGAVLAAVDLLPGFDNLKVGPLNPHQIGMLDLPQPLTKQRRPIDGPMLHEPIVDRIHGPLHRLAGERTFQAVTDAIWV